MKQAKIRHCACRFQSKNALQESVEAVANNHCKIARSYQLTQSPIVQGTHFPLSFLGLIVPTKWKPTSIKKIDSDSDCVTILSPRAMWKPL